MLLFLILSAQFFPSLLHASYCTRCQCIFDRVIRHMLCSCVHPYSFAYSLARFSNILCGSRMCWWSSGRIIKIIESSMLLRSSSIWNPSFCKFFILKDILTEVTNSRWKRDLIFARKRVRYNGVWAQGMSYIVTVVPGWLCRHHKRGSHMSEAIQWSTRPEAGVYGCNVEESWGHSRHSACTSLLLARTSANHGCLVKELLVSHSEA